ncbi:MAG: hypothetical protein KGJ07_06440 [Patescibacteria group bacterium]|nr:hypothetical protein [Patescibacteria group bacterium]
MNKNTMIAIVAIIVILVGGYGAYRLYKHYNKPQAAAPVAMAPTKTVSPTGAMMENSVYKTATDPKLGTFFTDLKGMTLYVYAKDTSGVSNCSGQCLVIWPAYVATSTANLPANVTVITRSDKTLQYAYKGMPLYYYINDKAVGDTKGQGIGGVWSVAK